MTDGLNSVGKVGSLVDVGKGTGAIKDLAVGNAMDTFSKKGLLSESVLDNVAAAVETKVAGFKMEHAGLASLSGIQTHEWAEKFNKPYVQTLMSMLPDAKNMTIVKGQNK